MRSGDEALSERKWQDRRVPFCCHSEFKVEKPKKTGKNSYKLRAKNNYLKVFLKAKKVFIKKKKKTEKNWSPETYQSFTSITVAAAIGGAAATAQNRDATEFCISTGH